MPNVSNIAIVGGGIVGTSIAWALANDEHRRIVVFERAVVAAGASGRTGALLRRHYSNEPEAMLAQLGHSVYSDWNARVGGDCGFVPEGLVVTVDTSGEHARNLEHLHANVEMQNRLGINSTVVTGDELREMQPFLETSDITLAAFEPDSGYVNSIAATQGMARAASRLGVDIRERCAVESIAVSGGRVTGVKTSEGLVAADVVVCAVGPWTPRLLDPLQLSVPISTLRVQIAIVQRPMELEHGHFVFIDTAAGVFTRPWGLGTSLVGVGGGDQHDEVDPDDFEPKNDPMYPTQAIAAISRRIPAMAGGVYLHGHAGLYDMTPDAHPIIGPTGIEGLYVAAGFSGAGFKKGPAVGICLAAEITGKKSPVDLSRFRLDRFSTDDWQLPWSDTEYTFSSDFGHKL